MSACPSWTTPAALASFRAHLASSKNVMALCGAGLSAASGLATFRGAGGLWRQHDSISLATPEAFKADPGLVWLFYAWRRHMALSVKPNKAHYALAELARGKERDFITLTQNVDGLSPRANHPADKLHLLHGSLMDIKCVNKACDYVDVQNLADPLCPSLAPASNPDFHQVKQQVGGAADQTKIDPRDLPHCPKCNSLLRPGVVWFGESLPEDTLDTIDNWIESVPSIDLILVIGTSAVVYPAAGYVDIARDRGARVAVINLEKDHGKTSTNQVTDKDWFFQGDASEIVPEILRDVIGDISHLSEEVTA